MLTTLIYRNKKRIHFEIIAKLKQTFFTWQTQINKGISES